MTSRGLKEADFEKIAHFIDRGVRITIEINKTLEGNITFCFVLYEKRF
jgi:glycine hydroxymethyltransferase